MKCQVIIALGCIQHMEPDFTGLQDFPSTLKTAGTAVIL